MMTCSECQLEIFAGELTLGDAALAHLAECEECRGLEQEVRLNSAALAELVEEVLPVAKPTPVPVRVSSPPISWRWALAAAAMFAVMFGTWWQVSQRPAETPEIAEGPEVATPDTTAQETQPVAADSPEPTVPEAPLVRKAVPGVEVARNAAPTKPRVAGPKSVIPQFFPATAAPMPAPGAAPEAQGPLGAQPEPLRAQDKPQDQLMIRMFTDDPNVVIYWLVDPVQGDQAL